MKEYNSLGSESSLQLDERECGKIQGTSQVEKPRLNNKNALKEQLSEGIVESEEISDKISGI